MDSGTHRTPGILTSNTSHTCSVVESLGHVCVQDVHLPHQHYPGSHLLPLCHHPALASLGHGRCWSPRSKSWSQEDFVDTTPKVPWTLLAFFLYVYIPYNEVTLLKCFICTFNKILFHLCFGWS